MVGRLVSVWDAIFSGANRIFFQLEILSGDSTQEAGGFNHFLLNWNPDVWRRWNQIWQEYISDGLQLPTIGWCSFWMDDAGNMRNMWFFFESLNKTSRSFNSVFSWFRSVASCREYEFSIVLSCLQTLQAHTMYSIWFISYSVWYWYKAVLRSPWAIFGEDRATYWN